MNCLQEVSKKNIFFNKNFDTVQKETVAQPIDMSSIHGISIQAFRAELNILLHCCKLYQSLKTNEAPAKHREIFR